MDGTHSINGTHSYIEELEQPQSGSTVAVGMSGGVDSTLTAVLLKEKGCKVIGVTMSSWNNDLPLPRSLTGVRLSCYGADESIDIEQCKTFCAQRGIEYHVIDVRDAYRTFVLDYFKTEYRSARTPNPCVHCNRFVKFGALLDGIRKQGIDFDYFCTGHYAALVRPRIPIEHLYRIYAAGTDASVSDTAAESFAVSGAQNRPVMLSCAYDRHKDQAYFLHRIPSPVLESVRFPLGSFTKAQTFEMARERKLGCADRSESQDFIPNEYFDILFSDKKSVCGDIVGLDDEKLGTHRGIEHYTVGQRRGLGVSANRPLYVHSIDAERNRIVLAGEDDLLSDSLEADSWVWAGNYVPRHEFYGEVKIRLATPPAAALITPLENGVYRISFKKPQRAIAPGQSAVVYLNGIIAGGGIISRAL